MSVFKLERSVTVGYSCELCFFVKRLCHLHRGVPEASELRWERFGTLISFDVGRSRWEGSLWPRGKTLLTSKCVPSPQIVFSYERPGLELQQKGEIATTEVKKVKKKEKSQLGSLSDSLLLQVGLYPECLFPTFEDSGLLHTFFCTHSSGMFGVYPAFFDFPSRSFLSYHLTQMKCDSLSLAGCRSSPTYSSPPSRWLRVCSSGDDSSCFWRDVPLMHARRAWRSGQLFASSPCLSSRSVKHANIYLCACVHACPRTPD